MTWERRDVAAELTDHDKKHITEEFDSHTLMGGWESGYYDVMTSLGYVGVWHDGDVTYRGNKIWNANEDEDV